MVESNLSEFRPFHTIFLALNEPTPIFGIHRGISCRFLGISIVSAPFVAFIIYSKDPSLIDRTIMSTPRVAMIDAGPALGFRSYFPSHPIAIPSSILITSGSFIQIHAVPNSGSQTRRPL